jgi:hypothetical protein
LNINKSRFQDPNETHYTAESEVARRDTSREARARANIVKMPGTTEEKAPLPIVDPTSATEEEIDPAVDRDRIRVVCRMSHCDRVNKASI